MLIKRRDKPLYQELALSLRLIYHVADLFCSYEIE